MFLPICGISKHFSLLPCHQEAATQTEKASQVFTAFLAIGGVITTAALFINSVPIQWQFLAASLTLISSAFYLFTTNKISIRQLIQSVAKERQRKTKTLDKAETFEKLQMRYAELYNFVRGISKEALPAKMEEALKRVFFQEKPIGEKLQPSPEDFLLVLPYYLKLFYCEKFKKEEIEKLKEVILAFSKGEAEAAWNISVGTLDNKISFFSNQLLVLLEPLLPLLCDKNQKGTAFLFDFISQLIFNVLPLYYKGGMLRIEKRFSEEKLLSYQQKNLTEEYQMYALRAGCVLPLLSHMCARRDFSSKALEKYANEVVKNCAHLKNKNYLECRDYFQRQKLESHVFVPKKAELIACVEMLDKLDVSYRIQFIKIFETLEKEAENPIYKKFLKDVKAILSVSVKEVGSYLEGNVQTAGEFFAKSYLIRESILNVFPTRADKKNVAKALLDICIHHVEQAGIEVRFLRQKSEVLLHAIDEVLEQDPESAAMFQFLSVHDLLAVVLLNFFAAHHLDKAKPFISKHREIVCQIIKELQIQELGKYEKEIESGINFGIEFILSPIDAVITTRWPFKSTAISVALATVFALFKKWIKTEKDREFYDALKPVILFLLLGVFGSDKKEKNALLNLENTFKSFYKNLYGFSLEEGFKNPALLDAHVKKVFSSFMAAPH